MLVAVAVLLLPDIKEAGGGGFAGLVPEDNPAIQAEIQSVKDFGFPVLSRVAIVQRDAHGLPPLTQANVVARALRLTQHGYPGYEQILGALPVINTFGLVPGSRERSTTAVTFLFFSPGMGFAEQTDLARRFARTNISGPQDHLIGVSGVIPGRVEQRRSIDRTLPWIEAVTVLVILVVIGVNFQALLAPAVTLTTAAVAYLLTVHTVAVVGKLLGVAVPSELEPLMVALLLGIVTDYVIFFLSGIQVHLRAGDSPIQAATRTTADTGPIVLVAGLTVAAGAASLLIAKVELFQTFGPALALAILVGLAVTITLLPALLAILGPGVFWPRRRAIPSTSPASASPATITAQLVGWSPSRFEERLLRRMSRPVTATLVTLACAAGLLVAASPIRHLTLGLSIIRSLPASNEVARAAQAATRGFSPGILSPTVLLLSKPNITDERVALARLEDLLDRQPGFAGIIGPREQPAPQVLGAVLSSTHNAARYVMISADDPSGGTAIRRLRALQETMPTLLPEAGLHGVTPSFAGDTALATAIVNRTRLDLRRIALAALPVQLLLLIVFLRALVAPLYLLAASVLVLSASIGLTTLVFQGLLGHDGLTFYVPFAAAVLLVALGSDYNIFGVGYIWDEARRRPLREALVTAVPRSTRAIAAAAITLAMSFGLLVLVPLQPFREFAFAMFAGILLDAFIVRSLIVPSLITLVGRFSSWPSHQLEHRRGPEAEMDFEPGAGQRRDSA
ncbi:MAG TPA: MMPL family transporter [Actinomycetes bacterium]|nr:MMPL family transporter [Actinomycetes bacterium]